MIPTRNIPTIPRDTYQNLPAAYTFVDPQTRGTIADESPRVVFIEVTNHCNLLCETCPRTFTSYEEPQTLSWENFLKIVEQFPKMERAVLHGIGEPLINKDLPAAFDELKSIVVAERLRRDRQPDLSNFVRGLNAEFDKR